MSRGARPGRDWQDRDRVDRINAGQLRQTERIRALLSSRRSAAEAPARMLRPGISVPTTVRYASTSAPLDWAPADRGRPIIDAILESIEDGTDRMVLAWPGRPGTGFAAAALTLREARASGRLADATLALWPWRNGATWSARSILVHPEDIAQIGARAADEIMHGASWNKQGLAQGSLNLLEMRLRDLVTSKSTEPSERSDRRPDIIVVRSPTLLETTAVFAPSEAARLPPYVCDAEQVLRRVRDHTQMGEKKAGLRVNVPAIGDPTRTPFAIFGLPTVVVLTEDAFALRKATRALRSYASTLRPSRRAPIEVGSYLPEPGLIGASAQLAIELPSLRFEADIKDASLAGLRRDLVALGRNFRQRGESIAADGASKALAFLRRSASLPIGLREAREIADILNDGDDEVDIFVKSLFRPKMILGPLAAAADLVPEFGEVTRQLVVTVEAKVATWEEETPVSAKLVQLLHDTAWNRHTTLLAVPDRWIADVYLSSDRAVSVACDVVDHRGLSDRLSSTSPTRIVVIGPTPEAARALLTAQISPERVVLLGDAAGVALLAAEIAPLGRIPAFAPIAGRARAMASALHRGGANEQLDLAEAEFRVAAVIPEGEIDLTRAGEAYRGEILRFTTSGHRIAYRPTSDVLRFSPGETRPFERVQARQVQPGDRILVLDAAVREPIRRALAGSRETLKQLALYHSRIAEVRAAVHGVSDTDKARNVLAAMQTLDPGILPRELQNVVRWLTADKAPGESDGGRQPRAARDWPRFRVFMLAADVDQSLADLFWRAAIVPARSYRVHEGYLFNQRVVQFVLDPEGTAAGAAAWKSKEGLWQLVLDAVDEVVDVTAAVEGAKGNG